jgi:hypothetical protein
MALRGGQYQINGAMARAVHAWNLQRNTRLAMLRLCEAFGELEEPQDCQTNLAL